MGGDYRDLQKWLSRYPCIDVMCVSYKCVQVMYQLGVQEHEQCAVSEYREFIHGAHWYTCGMWKT